MNLRTDHQYVWIVLRWYGLDANGEVRLVNLEGAKRLF